MDNHKISGGVVHELPDDLENALRGNNEALEIWEDLTPLSRNEWICWVEYVKKPETRQEHVKRLISKLNEGMRRPCCWLGCIHRTDKPLGASQKYLIEKKSKKILENNSQ